MQLAQLAGFIDYLTSIFSSQPDLHFDTDHWHQGYHRHGRPWAIRTEECLYGRILIWRRGCERLQGWWVSPHPPRRHTRQERPLPCPTQARLWPNGHCVALPWHSATRIQICCDQGHTIVCQRTHVERQTVASFGQVRQAPPPSRLHVEAVQDGRAQWHTYLRGISGLRSSNCTWFLEIHTWRVRPCAPVNSFASRAGDCPFTQVWLRPQRYVHTHTAKCQLSTAI